MKKCTALILLVSLLCSLVPDIGFAVNGMDDRPLLIHLEKDFETQDIGDTPYGFHFDEDSHAAKFEVDAVAKEDNAENKAMKVIGSDVVVNARQPWHYAPMTKDFVISMNIRLNETNISKYMYIYTDANLTRHTQWLDANNGHFPLMQLTNVLKVNGTQISNTYFEAERWYKLQFALDLQNRRITTYVDGTKIGNSVSMPVFTNLCELRISAPAVGGDYFIDDIRIYESSDVISEEEFASANAEWESSPLCPEEKYELGRLYQYDKYAYYVMYNKFLAMVGSKKVYKDNEFQVMPAKMIEMGSKIFAPVRGLSELFGADVYWTNKYTKLVIDHGTNKLEVMPGDGYYFVNYRPVKLYDDMEIIDGHAYLPLEVLANFFNVEYSVDGYIINFGSKLTFDRDFGPMNTNGRVRTYEEEIRLRINLIMAFERPTAETILEKYNLSSRKGMHPRVIFDDFDKVTEGIAKDPEYEALVNNMIARGEGYINTGNIVKYTLTDGLRASFSGALYNYGMYCTFAYKLTRDQKYLDFLKANIKSVAENFPDFSPYEALNLGNSANGLGPMYDWMYDEFDEKILGDLERIILELVFDDYEKAFASPLLNPGSFTSTSGNQPIIINNGLIGCAVALMDKYPERCAELIATAINSIEEAYFDFLPDGGWEEGLSYWQYTCDTLTYTLSTLVSTFGTDFGLSETMGLDNTVYYALSTKGSLSGFPWGDAEQTSPFHGMFMWHANKYNDTAIAELRKNNLSNASMIDVANWVFDTEGEQISMSDIEGDTLFSKIQTATMRTGWAKSDTAVSFHGGGNSDGHGHHDIGSFQFDMLGVRWADEVPREDYNLRNYGSYDAANRVPDYKYNYRDYYRGKAEGHNTIVGGYGTTRFDMVPQAEAEIVKHYFGETMSYAIMDLTESNDMYKRGVRGIQLDKVRNQLIVQDNFTAESPMEFWWFMHTKTDIELSEDGKSAILSKNGKRIWASIISDGDYVFQILPASPLREYTINGVTYPPPLQTPNDGYHRLAVQSPSTDHFELTVVFAPLVGDEEVPFYVPEAIPMSKWSPSNVTRGYLNDVSVDGVSLADFEPSVYNYDIDVITEKSAVPKIEASADDKYEIEVIESEAVPGITNVQLKENGEITAIYSFSINPLNDTTRFLNDRQIPIVGYTVTSEPQPENNAGNLFDADHSTKFATDESGGAVTIDFGEVKTVKELMMAFLNGTTRKEIFRIEYSEDGKSFKECFDGTSSGTSSDYESFDVGCVKARYIKVSFYGNSSGSNWVSVTELCAFTE